jgi:hypothetical protein
MNPYLEAAELWPQFHQQLVTTLYQILLPGLVDRYRSRLVPRVYTCETPLFTSIVREEHREETIEIRNRSDGRLVTLIDIVSPANKTTAAGRQAYLQRHRAARSEQATTAEIDLVLQGRRIAELPVEDASGYDYAVVVTRGTQPRRPEAYPWTLQKRLPKVRLPMAGDDKDTLIDLQPVFLRAFEQGCFGEKIAYERDPGTALRPDQLEWIDGVLKQHQLRS